jgi:hypothetical protein
MWSVSPATAARNRSSRRCASVRAGGQRQVEAAADEEVRRARGLAEQDRVLVPHRDHGRPEADPLGVLPDGGEERQRRGQVVVEVALVGPSGLVAQLLGRPEERDAVAEPLRRAGGVAERHPGVEAQTLRPASGRGGNGGGHAPSSLTLVGNMTGGAVFDGDLEGGHEALPAPAGIEATSVRV